MSELLEQAIAKLQALPEREQEAIAWLTTSRIWCDRHDDRCRGWEEWPCSLAPVIY